eukprot:1482986-Alexandrium_andersonii.AAC.1
MSVAGGSSVPEQSAATPVERPESSSSSDSSSSSSNSSKAAEARAGKDPEEGHTASEAPVDALPPDALSAAAVGAEPEQSTKLCD